MVIMDRLFHAAGLKDPSGVITCSRALISIHLEGWIVFRTISYTIIHIEPLNSRMLFLSYTVILRAYKL